MQLGQAREKLGPGPGVEADPAGALTLVSAAHDNAKEALVELRDLARGIHPPALDVGLEAALATLAARNAIPTQLHVDVPVRPPEAIESIAYFTVAELLANATKHSGAHRIRVGAATRGDVLNLWVQDDGSGGAHLGGGTGLVGLSDRVHAVDGSIRIQSPPGGPTVITVQLPAGLRTAHHPTTPE